MRRSTRVANIYYLTLPGSLLEKFAKPRGFRCAAVQLDEANTTCGRHSGPLTRGSLYPLALAGVDLDEWMAGTSLSSGEIDTAWRLSAFLHTQGLAGRDKVTLLLPPSLSGAAMWTKQEFEESLGKSAEHGIKIVIGEPVRMTNYRPPRDPYQDRVFLGIEMKGSTAGASSKVAEKLALLRRAGYPVAVLSLEKGPLSRYMQFVHYAVFGVAWLRKMNFVTQPNVELYKSIANRLHAESQRAGGIEKTKEWRQSIGYSAQCCLARKSYAALGPAACYVRTQRIHRSCDLRVAVARFHKRSRVRIRRADVFWRYPVFAAGRAARAVLDRAAERLFRARLQDAGGRVRRARDESLVS